MLSLAVWEIAKLLIGRMDLGHELAFEADKSILGLRDLLLWRPENRN